LESYCYEKKNRCPPSSNGCGSGQNHLDFAAPGYDNLQYSTANICSQRTGTGFTSQQQSGVCGSWYSSYPSTQGCFGNCAQLPAALRSGCELFSLWGWKSGNPTLNYQVVTCPPAYVNYIKQLFNQNGVTSYPFPTTYSVSTTTIPPPVTTPTAPSCNPACGSNGQCTSNNVCTCSNGYSGAQCTTAPVTTPTAPTAPTGNVITSFAGSNGYYGQIQITKSVGTISSVTLSYSGQTFTCAYGWVDSASYYYQLNGIQYPGITSGQTVTINVSTSSGTYVVTTNWLLFTSTSQTKSVVATETETETLEDIEEEEKEEF